MQEQQEEDVGRGDQSAAVSNYTPMMSTMLLNSSKTRFIDKSRGVTILNLKIPITPERLKFRSSTWRGSPGLEILPGTYEINTVNLPQVWLHRELKCRHIWIIQSGWTADMRLMIFCSSTHNRGSTVPKLDSIWVQLNPDESRCTSGFLGRWRHDRVAPDCDFVTFQKKPNWIYSVES